jgi:hypothetical protein
MIGASPLQAFAAGSALCATSLGTTFTLLSTSGLSSSRLGVVLTSAAMMDDVVGLIMVQVISNLGETSSFDAVTVVRPIFVSLGLATVLPLVCRFVVLPVTRGIVKLREAKPASSLNRVLCKELTSLTLYTATLVAIVAGATYAGSSALLGAYIAGAIISWWDAVAPQPQLPSPSSSAGETPPNNEAAGTPAGPDDQGNAATRSNESYRSHSGTSLFGKYYEPALCRVFKPLFFVSWVAQLLSGCG